jgi:hypothetical protein
MLKINIKYLPDKIPKWRLILSCCCHFSGPSKHLQTDWYYFLKEQRFSEKSKGKKLDLKFMKNVKHLFWCLQILCLWIFKKNKINCPLQFIFRTKILTPMGTSVCSVRHHSNFFIGHQIVDNLVNFYKIIILVFLFRYSYFSNTAIM